MAVHNASRRIDWEPGVVPKGSQSTNVSVVPDDRGGYHFSVADLVTFVLPGRGPHCRTTFRYLIIVSRVQNRYGRMMNPSFTNRSDWWKQISLTTNPLLPSWSLYTLLRSKTNSKPKWTCKYTHVSELSLRLMSKRKQILSKNLSIRLYF